MREIFKGVATLVAAVHSGARQNNGPCAPMCRLLPAACSTALSFNTSDGTINPFLFLFLSSSSSRFPFFSSGAFWLVKDLKHLTGTVLIETQSGGYLEAVDDGSLTTGVPRRYCLGVHARTRVLKTSFILENERVCERERHTHTHTHQLCSTLFLSASFFIWFC